MADIRIHRYTVDPAEIEELRPRRADLIAAVRAAHPGLIEARLVRPEGGTFSDSWRWESAEQMQAALGGGTVSRGWPGVVPHSGRHLRGREIVDER